MRTVAGSNGGGGDRDGVTAIVVSRMSRLSAWIGGPAAAGGAQGGPDRDADRALFARIGDFLDRHALEPTVAHYRIAHGYVLGEDPRLSATIDRRVRDHGIVDAAFLQSLAAPDPLDPLSPDSIADMADALSARLVETETTFRQSHASARDYERALSVEAGAAVGDPDGTVKRLLALTHQAIVRNRQLSARLEETHRETNQLRTNLQDARRAADEDHLTGLPNRRCFDRRLHDLTAMGTTGAARCVALCDIDDFKTINDRHGHDTGDRVLKRVARHLTTELGATVLVARHGGEEFACLFEGCTPDVAAGMLDGARETLGARMLVNQASGDGIGRLTFSGGVAVLAGDAAGAMRAADAALYAAKHAGKNRIVFTASDGTA